MQPGRVLNRNNQLDIAALLMDMSVGAVLFGIGRRAAELGASAAELGVLGAAMPVTYTLFALVAGGLSDKMGRRRVTLGGASIAIGFALACAFTTKFWLLVAFNVVLGLGVGLFWPALIAWIGEGLTGSVLSKRLARFSVAWNIGLLLGFGLTGYLFKYGGPRLPFVLAAGSILLIIVLLSLPIPAKPLSVSLQPVDPIRRVPKGRGFRKTSWLANFGMTFTFFGIIALFPQLATRLEIDAGMHGVLLALWRLGAFFMFLVVPHLQFWQTRLWPVWAAQAVSVIAVVCFGLASDTWAFALALFVGGLMLGFNYQASIFFTLEEMSEKGKGSGVHEATLGAGMCFGPILAGVVGDKFSLRAPYFFCAGFLLIWIGVQMAIVAWRRRQKGDAAVG